MSGNKTIPTGLSVSSFLKEVEPTKKREQAERLRDLFMRVTGYQAMMWGPTIVGFGRYHFKYASGREGDFLATGFSPRKAGFSIYIMPGYRDYSAMLSGLGKYSAGRSCLRINKLEDIDLNVLEKLIRTGLTDLNRIWPVKPT